MPRLPGPAVQAWVDTNPGLAALLALLLLLALIVGVGFWIRLKGHGDVDRGGY